MTEKDALRVPLKRDSYLLNEQCCSVKGQARPAAGHSSSQAMLGPFWRHERGVAADGAGWHDAPMHRHGPDVAILVMIGQTRPPSRHVAATRPRLLGRLSGEEWLTGWPGTHLLGIPAS